MAWCQYAGACAALAYRNGQTIDHTPRTHTILWFPMSLTCFCVWMPCAWLGDRATKTFGRILDRRKQHPFPVAFLRRPAIHLNCIEMPPILWLSVKQHRLLWSEPVTRNEHNTSHKEKKKRVERKKEGNRERKKANQKKQLIINYHIRDRWWKSERKQRNQLIFAVNYIDHINKCGSASVCVA